MASTMRNQLFAFAVDAPKKFVNAFCFCAPFFDVPERDLVDLELAGCASDAFLDGLMEVCSCSVALVEDFAFALPFAGAAGSGSSFSSTDSYEE